MTAETTDTPAADGVSLNLRLVLNPPESVLVGVVARGLKPYVDIEIEPTSATAATVSVTSGGGAADSVTDLVDLFELLVEQLSTPEVKAQIEAQLAAPVEDVELLTGQYL